RDYFMQRYHDVISSFGGKTSYDADNRPLLVMRSNLWASGYDVDGTDQTSLGQFSGRVQQTYKHSVPRFFVPQRINIIGSREGSRNRRRLKANQTDKKFRVGIKSNISTNRNNLISGVDRCIHLNAMKKTTITSINRQTIKI